MTFEEDFPSLKDNLIGYTTELKYGCEVIEETDYRKVLISHVQGHCLDKKRVKEAFRKTINKCVEKNIGISPLIILEQELGL